MAKPLKLSTQERRTTSAARNVLSRLGVSFPTAINSSVIGRYEPTKAELKRFVEALNVNKQLVVTIAGPAKQFQIMTIESYLARREHAKRMTKSRMNKGA